MEKGKIIAVVNQKGGVGKTTTTISLGYGLAEKGKKVLLIDFDPQSSLTVCMGIDDTDSLTDTIAALMKTNMMDEPIMDHEKYVLHHENVDFIPSNIELSAIEVSLVAAMSREYQLKNILDLYQNDYDYIIVDCNPSLGMLTINALTAADEILIPCNCEFMSAKGLELLLRNIIKVHKNLNPDLKIMGILLTMYKGNTNLNKQIDQMINGTYGKDIHIFHTKIPASIKMSEASMNAEPIYTYSKNNKVAIAYKELVKEVENND